MVVKQSSELGTNVWGEVYKDIFVTVPDPDDEIYIRAAVQTIMQMYYEWFPDLEEFND